LVPRNGADLQQPFAKSDVVDRSLETVPIVHPCEIVDVTLPASAHRYEDGFHGLPAYFLIAQCFIQRLGRDYALTDQQLSNQTDSWALVLAHGFLQAQAFLDVFLRAGAHGGENLTECLAAITFNLERALQLRACDLVHSDENLAGQLPLLSVAEGAQGRRIE